MAATCALIPGTTDGQSPQLAAALIAKLSLVHAPAQASTDISETYSKCRAWLEAHEHDVAAGEGEANNKHTEAFGYEAGAASDAAVLLLSRLCVQLAQHNRDGRGCIDNYGLPISSIVKLSGTSLTDLFEELPVTCHRLAPCLPVPTLQAFGHLQEWACSCTTLATLARKFKAVATAHLSSLGNNLPAAMQLGWLLFLLLKPKLLPRFPDLVSCMELLVCVVRALLVRLPPAPEGSDMQAAQQGDHAAFFVAGTVGVDLGHVKELMVSVEALVKVQLLSCCPTQASDAALWETPGLLADVLAQLDAEYGATNMRHSEIDERDMLAVGWDKGPSSESSSPPAALPMQVLGPGYATPIHSNKQPAALGHHLGSGSFIFGSSTPQQQASRATTAVWDSSPLPLSQLGCTNTTPVTEALGCVAWLRATTSTMSAEPSSQLVRCFAACTPNPGAAIAKRVQEMTAAAFPEERVPVFAYQPTHSSLAEIRRTEAVKLYYHVLELVLTGEEGVGSPQPQACHTSLLTSSKLHKGLMACSLEVILACYKVVSSSFPRVLELIKLHAFDLIKIVQTFVRYMPSMPLELKRHLYTIEERTVEGLAWQPGSSLYTLLMTAMGSTGATSAQPAQQAPGACPPPGPVGVSHASPVKTSLGGARLSSPCGKRNVPDSCLQSPMKRARSLDGSPVPTVEPVPVQLDLLPSAVGRPPSPAALAATHPEAAAALSWLHEFLRKVLKLAWFRLGWLCQSLDFGPGRDPASVRKCVYVTVEHAVYHHTHLLYNRHLDQLLLSSMYGFCKVKGINSVNFRDIILQHRRQPQSSQAIVRSVVMAQTNPGLQVQTRGDIIAFYNQVFVPPMKQFLMEAAASEGRTSLHPPRPGPPASQQLPLPRPSPPASQQMPLPQASPVALQQMPLPRSSPPAIQQLSLPRAVPLASQQMPLPQWGPLPSAASQPQQLPMPCPESSVESAASQQTLPLSQSTSAM